MFLALSDRVLLLFEQIRRSRSGERLDGTALAQILNESEEDVERACDELAADGRLRQTQAPAQPGDG